MAHGNGGHKAAIHGKRVMVLLVSGEHFIARYGQARSKTIEFIDHKPVLRRDIRTISDYHPGTTR